MHCLNRLLKSGDESILPDRETNKLFVVIVEAASLGLRSKLSR